MKSECLQEAQIREVLKVREQERGSLGGKLPQLGSLCSKKSRTGGHGNLSDQAAR